MTPAHDGDSSGPRYRIGRVAELTGLSTHAIRVWERRYGVVKPRRSEGGERLYSHDDVEKLDLLHRLSERGHPIGTVAHMGTSELQDLSDVLDSRATVVTTPPASPAGVSAAMGLDDIRRRFFDSVAALDIEAASEALARAALLLPTRDLLVSLIAPIVREVGDRWERGELTVAQEHAASALLRNVLGALLRTFVPAPDAPVAVSTTPPGERHEFGALMVALLAAARGWRTLYLGPDLPAEETIGVSKMVGARLLMLSSATSADPERRKHVRKIVRGVGRTTRVVLGGMGAESFGAAGTGAKVVTDLSVLDAELSLGR
ncbi:MAG: MerR family transcriptional regulator [Deltaproteobacteria bacterium]|nr:MerR family transcriptional regulator [Deltaproteobacteria bacterium]